jgi:hypothetical protein
MRLISNLVRKARDGPQQRRSRPRREERSGPKHIDKLPKYPPTTPPPQVPGSGA